MEVRFHQVHVYCEVCVLTDAGRMGRTQWLAEQVEGSGLAARTAALYVLWQGAL